MDKEEEQSEHLVYGPHPKSAVLLQQEETFPIWAIVVIAIVGCVVVKLIYNKLNLGNWIHQGESFWFNLLLTLVVFKKGLWPFSPAWSNFEV